MRHAANEAGLDLEIDSAGTANYHIGEPPDPRSIAEAARRGIDIAHYRGRQLQPEDFRRFDWIVAMDLPNIREIERIRPADATARVVMLFDLVEGREGDEVADPWYGEAEGFSRTWTDVAAGAAALIERLR